jgi:hypothetical protein
MAYSASYAEGFQSYEAGTYPIRARIEVINKTITDIESSLKSPDLSSNEKETLDECLRQYATEKKQLEEDLEAGRKLNQSGLVNYLSADAEQECASPTHHSSGRLTASLNSEVEWQGEWVEPPL